MRRPGKLTDVVKRSPLKWHLLAISFATGLLDATTYGDLQLFASNQTGNTIILFVLVLGKKPGEFAKYPDLLPTGVSLATFLTMGFLWGRAGLRAGPRKRWWQVLSLAFQSGMLLLLAILLDTHVLHPGLPLGHGRRTNDAALACLLAAPSGAQVALARSSGISEIPTAMLTSPYIDFFLDPNLWSDPRKVDNPKVKTRNTRAIYLLCIITGSIVGALMHRHASSSAALYLAFAMRLVGLIATLYFPTYPAEAYSIDKTNP